MVSSEELTWCLRRQYSNLAYTDSKHLVSSIIFYWKVTIVDAFVSDLAIVAEKENLRRGCTILAQVGNEFLTSSVAVPRTRQATSQMTQI